LKRHEWWIVAGVVVVVMAALVVVLQPWSDDWHVRAGGANGTGGSVVTGGRGVDANRWAEVATDGASVPPKRDNACMVYDPVVDRVLLFGGNSEEGNDTWSFNPNANAWVELNPAGDLPAPRYGPAYAVVDRLDSPLNGAVIMFGGYNNREQQSLNDTWLYDPAANTWKCVLPGDADSPNLPVPRLGASLEYDPVSGLFLMFGGWNAAKYKLFNDLWAYDPVANTWTELKPEGPIPPVRDGAGFVRDPGSGRIILFGGVGFDEKSNLAELGDTWSYDPAAGKWTQRHPAHAPSPRDGMLMVYEPVSGLMYLFGGGEEGEKEKNDTWVYDPAANTWKNLHPHGTVPSKRMNYNMVSTGTHGRLVLVAGARDHWSKLFGDTWIYTPPAPESR
jgi:hypothetical protein